MESVPLNYGQEKPTHKMPTAGPRMKNAVARKLRGNMAIAREAAKSELRLDEFNSYQFRRMDSLAASVEEHHNDPEAGHPAESGITGETGCRE